MKTLLVTAQPYDPVAGARVTLYMTNRNDAAATLPAGQVNEYLPILTGGPVITRAVFNGEFSDLGDNGGSSLSIRLDEGTLSSWLGYVWAGAVITIMAGAEGAAYAGFSLVQTMSATGLVRRSGVAADVTMQSGINLARQLLYLSFAGTDNGSGSDSGEGRAENMGTLKPWLSGVARFVDPVLIDAPRQIYCYHGYGNTIGASECFEGGVTKGAPAFLWTTFALMVAETMTAGQWGHCPSLGMIRLGGLPSFPVTIHVSGDAPGGVLAVKTGDVLKRILEGPGGLAAPAISATNLAAINASRPDGIDVYHTDQGAVLQILTELMLAANGYWIEDAAGKVQLGIIPPELSGFVARLPTTTILAAGDAFASWAGGVASAPFTTFTDATAGSQTSFNSAAGTALVTGTTYTFVLRVKKDSIPKTTRFALFRLAGSAAGDWHVDSSTGEIASASALPFGSFDGGDSWIVWLQAAATATSAVTATIFPAVGVVATMATAMSSAGWAVATTGSMSFKSLQAISGAQVPTADRLLDLDGNSAPAVKASGEDTASVPAYRVRVGGRASHYVHAPNDIPASIVAAQSTADAAAYVYPPSSSPPSSPTPTLGDVWPDNGTGAIVMRRWTGAAWQAITEVGTAVNLIPIGSVAAADVIGNSFKRTVAGPDYNYAVRSSVAFASSAYVRMGAVASGVSIVSLDDDTTSTAAASMNYRFEVNSSGAWTFSVAGAATASGTTSAVAVDTNIELRYKGNVVEALIGSAVITSVVAAPQQSLYGKWHAYQISVYRQLAAGFATLNLDATILNTAITINPNGTLSGAGGGTPDALQLLNGPSQAGATYNKIRGAWTSGFAYIIGDVVSLSGSSYSAILAHTSAAGNAPPNATYWQLFAQAGVVGTDAVTASISKENISLQAYANGTLVSLAGASGQWAVFQGATDVTASATYASTATGCTGSVNAAGAYSVTAMSASTAKLSMTATYNGVTYTKVMSLTQDVFGYEIVGTLPASSLFDGRIVYLTTDKKLYRYNGTATAWQASVATTDLTGQITAAQITALTITANELAAGAVTAAKIAVSSLSAITATIGTLRTATTGARVEISDNLIQVFDSAGTVRVKLGLF